MINPIKFCNICGHEVRFAVPDGDNRERHICPACGEIQYQNPKIVAGCIPVWEDRILICRRAIEPRYGYWTIPAGFMENGETIEQGAARETVEEACAEVRDMALYQIVNVLRVHQVYILFRGELVAEDGFDVGPESLEVKLVEEHEIPWDQMAFRVVELTLRRFLEERAHGNFTVQQATL